MTRFQYPGTPEYVSLLNTPFVGVERGGRHHGEDFVSADESRPHDDVGIIFGGALRREAGPHITRRGWVPSCFRETACMPHDRNCCCLSVATEHACMRAFLHARAG